MNIFLDYWGKNIQSKFFKTDNFFKQPIFEDPHLFSREKWQMRCMNFRFSQIRQKMQGQINNLIEAFEQAQGRIRSLQGHVNYLKTSYSNIFNPGGQGEPSMGYMPSESAGQGYDSCDCNYWKKWKIREREQKTRQSIYITRRLLCSHLFIFFFIIGHCIIHLYSINRRWIFVLLPSLEIWRTEWNWRLLK